VIILNSMLLNLVKFKGRFMVPAIRTPRHLEQNLGQQKY
jgi:hypothetical protein